MHNRKHHRYVGVRPGKQTGSYLIDFYDYQGIRHQKTFYGSEADAAKTRRMILAQQDRIKAGLEAPPDAPSKVLTLHQLWQAFTEDRQLKIRSGSMSAKSLLRNLITYNAFLECDPALRSRRLDQIKPADFEAFKIYRQERGFSPEGINTNLRGLRTLFNFAVRQEFQAKSPLRDVPLVKVPHSDVRFLNEDELRSLYFAIDQLDLAVQFQRDARDLTLFYLFTGCRVSEALFPQFTWANDGQNALHFRQEKTSKGRSLPKGDQIKEILEGRKGEEGGPFRFDKYEVYHRVKWLLKNAGIEDASPHTLRKTAGSMFYLASRDIFATSRFLGHSSVSVTEKHYAGLIQSLQVENHLKFEEVLNSRLLHSRYFDPKPHQSSPIDPPSKSPHFSSEKGGSPLVPRAGFEPTTDGLEGRCLPVDKRKKVTRKGDKWTIS